MSEALLVTTAHLQGGEGEKRETHYWGGEEYEKGGTRDGK